MNSETILAIKNDAEFLKQATNLLEGMPHGIKKFRVKKFGNEGKGSWKMLYLSLAHGKCRDRPWAYNKHILYTTRH
jgi:hypothetical protein